MHFLDQSTEHLETKKKIENLRERFGEENWLHNLAGSYVKDILGLPNHNSPSPILSSTPNDSQLPSKYKENISTLVSSGYNNDKEEIPNVSPILDEVKLLFISYNTHQNIRYKYYEKILGFKPTA